MAHNFGKVLVTGGAGFIGSHLVDRLVAEKQDVRVLEKPGVDTSHLPEHKIEIIPADLRDKQSVENAVKGCDVVLHLAANPNLWAPDPDEFEQVNHQGTRHVLEAARNTGARRVVHVSTESILAPLSHNGVITEQTRTILDDMIGPYCRSKWLAEQAARQAAEAGDPVVIVSPSIPIGPGDRNLGPPSRMICDFCNGRIKAHLNANLNLIDVHDVADGIWAAAQNGEIGRSYLLVHENWTILDLLQYLADLVERPVPRWRVPYSLALAFGYLEEWFCSYVVTGRRPMATVTGVKLTQRSLHFDGQKSARDLGLKAMRSCRKAIAESVDWLRKSGNITLPGKSSN